MIFVFVGAFSRKLNFFLWDIGPFCAVLRQRSWPRNMMSLLQAVRTTQPLLLIAECGLAVGGSGLFWNRSNG